MGDPLQTFRGLEIEPAIFNPAAQPIRADVVGNNAYFNNLSVIGNAAGTQDNSITTNFITPQSNPDFNGDWHLGIYGVADGTAPHAVVLDIYESVTNPGTAPNKGGTYEKLSICSSPPSGPFVITTAYSFPVPGQPRGIDVTPSGMFRFGSNTTPYWEVLSDGSGFMVPINGLSEDFGSLTNALANVWSVQFNIVNWTNGLAGSWKWDNPNARTVLDVGSGAGFITANHIQLNSASTLFSGAGPPSGATGVNGDIFINSTGAAGATLYVKRAGAWVAATGV